MIVPHSQLDPDTLTGLIEAFVCREGTDYGEVEFGLDHKVSSVRRQLASGEVSIVFDEESGSFNIISTTKAQGMGTL